MRRFLAEVRIEREKCDLCGKCVNLCPFHSLAMVSGVVKQVRDCFLCGICLAVCDKKAIELIPKTEVKEIQSLRLHNHRS